jgi:KDO2-lipid IV(A) lauroyltransferase
MLGYRKRVVFENLRNSFPEKSEMEITKIATDFYSYFCDLIVEVIKNFTISKKEISERCKIVNSGPFDKFYKENKSIVIAMGHYGNWELAGLSISLNHDFPFHVIYHPLKNPEFESLFYKMRSRFGMKLISMNDTFKEIIKHKDELTGTVFIADQTPHNPHVAYWTNFLNQDTAVFEGVEKISRRMNYPVVYSSVKRVKRGYYQIHLETLIENSKETALGEISELHTRRLEQDIIEDPSIWLWSHRRWKLKDSIYYKENRAGIVK